MATYKELLQAWDDGGRPRDMDSIHNIMMEFMSHEEAQAAFSEIGLALPDQAPEVEDVPTEDPLVDVEVPIDYVVTSNTGKEFTWKGAQWVSGGRIVKKEFKDRITTAAKQQIQKDAEAKRVNDEATAKAKDDQIQADHTFGSEESAPSAEQRVNADAPETSTTSQKSDDAIAKLADKLGNSGKGVKIAELLGQNDPIADIAASILAKGQAKKVIKILGQ